MASAFKVFFNDLIWSRGAAYYKAGKVTSLTKIGSTWVAVVKGTKPYQVCFTTDPVSMKCNCPNAQEGHHCKHMAAAFIAYEKQKEKPQKTTEKNPYKDTEWYGYIKQMVDRKGRVFGTYNFKVSLRQYLYNVKHEIEKGDIAKLDELLLLFTFVDTCVDGNWQDELFTIIADLLYNVRQIGGNKKKAALDLQLQSLMRKAKHSELLTSLIQHYFCEKEDIPILLDLVKNADIAPIVLPLLFQIIDDCDAEKAQLEQICLDYIDNDQARNWLITLYKQGERIADGIALLEKYCYSETKINQDIANEKLQLLYFYSKAGRTTSRDSLFQELSKNRKVNKQVLFSTMKTAMSPEEWQKTGKQYLRDWADGKKNETCFDVFHKVRAGDLIFERMVSDGFLLHELKDHFKVLAEYDEGAVYAMYKTALQHELAQTTSIRWALSDFKYVFPNTENAIAALKLILLELQEEFSYDQSIVHALESLEESLYEK